MSEPPWLREGRGLCVESAAEYIGCSVSYLNKLRVLGGGPEFEKIGRRVLYSKAGIDSWREVRRYSNTSEYQESADANAS